MWSLCGSCPVAHRLNLSQNVGVAVLHLLIDCPSIWPDPVGKPFTLSAGEAHLVSRGFGAVSLAANSMPAYVTCLGLRWGLGLSVCQGEGAVFIGCRMCIHGSEVG